MAFKDTLAADRRLSILLVLAQTPGYSTNAFLLRDAVDQIYGHRASLDVVRTDMAWLSEQGLATERLIGEVAIATLSARGQDVASGAAVVPGVKKPSAL